MNLVDRYWRWKLRRAAKAEEERRRAVADFVERAERRAADRRKPGRL